MRIGARYDRVITGPVRVMRIIARMNVGGPAIHVSLLAARLNDDHFRTTLVTGMIGADEGNMDYLAHELNIELVVVPSLQREILPGPDFRALLHLIRLIRVERPHVVHTHTAKAGLVGRLAAWLCGVPVIVHTFHGHVLRGYFGTLKTRLFIWLERLGGLASDTILTISDGLREELQNTFRIAPAHKFRVLPLGLDLTPLTSLKEQRGALRRELGIADTQPLIGIVGRLVPIKNHALFLQAARLVADVNPRACFAIIGDGELRAVLQQQSAELDLTEQVRFTGWRKDLGNVYADLDLVVISSDNEGTPVSLIEAMAAGVPVIGTQVGGIPDLLAHGELGILVPPQDARSLGQAMLQALSQPSGERAVRARRVVLAEYSVDRLAADIRALYIELLTRKGFTAEWQNATEVHSS